MIISEKEILRTSHLIYHLLYIYFVMVKKMCFYRANYNDAGVNISNIQEYNFEVFCQN